jgi:hypothetical protein
VALALVAAIGAVAYATVLAPDPPAPHPVRVRAVTARPVDERLLDVTVAVANEHPDRKTARVWWLLSVPGRGPEWERRVYRSSVRPLTLARGERAELRWSEEAPVPSGTYVVSAWVHVEGPHGFTHEDGEVGGRVRVTSGPGDLLRTGPPRFGVAVIAVDTRAAAATVVVQNSSTETQRARLRWAAFPAEDTVGTDWWRTPAAVWGRSLPVDLAPGETREVRLDDLGTLPPGRYGLRFVLDSTAREAGGAFDDVAVASPVEAG